MIMMILVIIMITIMVIIISILITMIKIMLIVTLVIIINSPFQPGGFSIGSTTAWDEEVESISLYEMLIFFFLHIIIQRCCGDWALLRVLPNFYSLNLRVFTKAGINNFNLSWLLSVESILEVCFFILLICYFFQFLGIFSCWVTMPQRSNVFDCWGSYNGTPYPPAVSASLLKYLKDRRRWIDTMPNNHKSAIWKELTFAITTSIEIG